MPNQAGINFSTGQTSSGKDANAVYNGHNGVVHNPQTGSGAKASSAQTMSSMSSAARNTAAGFNGVVHNPQTSTAAKSAAAEKGANMPAWNK
ncbi:hypothetical protein RQP46_006022 [Phenoliferia psychrophenolica]